MPEEQSEKLVARESHSTSITCRAVVQRGTPVGFSKNERTSRSTSVAMSKIEESAPQERIQERVLLHKPSHVLHSFRVLSQEPDNMVEPSGEKQQQ